MRVLLPVREQKEHLRPCGPATARLEDGKPGREAVADRGPAVGLLGGGHGRDHRVRIGGQVGEDGGRIVKLDEPHARRARAEIELKDELARKLEHLGLEWRHTPRVVEDKHQVEGQPVAALGRTRWPRWRRRPQLTRAAVETVGAVHARRAPLGAGAAIVAIGVERPDARVRAEARLTRSAVKAVGAVHARRAPLGAGAAIVAIAIEGVRWISNARVRTECCLKRAVVRLTARGDVLAERDFALGARAQCGGDEQEGHPKEAPHCQKGDGVSPHTESIAEDAVVGKTRPARRFALRDENL
jgi:hypothetical protein